MGRLNRALVFVSLLAAGVLAFSSPAVAQTKYTVTDLGVLDGLVASYATGIYENGEVSGYCLNLDKDEFACGFSFRSKNFVFKNGRMTEAVKLRGPGKSAADSESDDNAIPGRALVKQLRSSRRIPALVTPVGNLGDGVGYASISPSVLVNGIVLDLPKLSGYTISAAEGINDSGQIVGYCGVENGGDSRSFLCEDGKFTYLDELSGKKSKAFSINNRGQIVGETGAYSESRAYLYEHGKMVDLNTRIPTASGLLLRYQSARAQSSWLLRSASGINNRGQIVGWGIHNGKHRAFLLTPVVHGDVVTH